MFCKVYKENQKELEKCTTSTVCVSYEQLSDLQLILVIVDTTAAPDNFLAGCVALWNIPIHNEDFHTYSIQQVR